MQRKHRQAFVRWAQAGVHAMSHPCNGEAVQSFQAAHALQSCQASHVLKLPIAPARVARSTSAPAARPARVCMQPLPCLPSSPATCCSLSLPRPAVLAPATQLTLACCMAYHMVHAWTAPAAHAPATLLALARVLHGPYGACARKRAQGRVWLKHKQRL